MITIDTLANYLFHGVAKVYQHGVAGLVAEVIIKVFQAIQIDGYNMLAPFILDIKGLFVAKSG